MDKLEQLKAIGFKKIGSYPDDFNLKEKKLPSFKKDYYSCLYAFVLKRKIKYIGYTSTEITQRLNNHEKLKEHSESIIDIYMSIFDEKAFDKFYIDTSQGLEYSLIEHFEPEWNKEGKPSKEKRGLE